MRYGVIVGIAVACFLRAAICSATQDLCKDENTAFLNRLYNAPSEKSIKSIFPIILSCGPMDSLQKKQGQYVALIGGIMRQHEEWIDLLVNSANLASESIAAKICLNALWFCNTEKCRAKLKSRPFSLPQVDIDKLLAETPPDPYKMPIRTGADLDFLWGYFIATGDKSIPQRILSEIVLSPVVPNNIEEKLTRHAARWSFLSMAEQHDIVRNVLIEESKKSDRAADLLKEMP